ncbi:acetylxylan esterase [Ruania zhangjianzhongii]|uniref:acetylxylan esterase n=1 Tax=Ruania zhangjianzhongii TaxID=2603206 RepID=UPI0011CB966A|nr:acetylxylan esterase [Ruania zhangjianzhongii]
MTTVTTGPSTRQSTADQRPPFEEWFPEAPMDATYGYGLEALLQVSAPAPPEDFAEFWQSLQASARAVQPAPELADYPMLARAHTLHRVDFTSLGGLRLGGWVALPKDGPVRVGVVFSHGYGGREEPDLAGIPDDAAVIFPVARGLPAVSLMPQVLRPTDGHVLEGIESRDSYVLGGCAADLWCAASALTELVGQVPLVFVGGSFGGGQGALALPWDDRFVAAALRVPSFGQYDIRLHLPCTGSGERVREHVALHPRAREVLRYFDAATAAGFLRVPTLFGCALWDPSVPPPGQFAVYNAALAAIGDRARLQVLSAGHETYPSEAAEGAVWLRGVRTLINEAGR